MQVLSADAETAILARLGLWPNWSALIGARWSENVWRGENGRGWLGSLVDDDDDARNESNDGIDQKWIFESGDPDRRKFDVRSTAKHVVGWR